MRPWNLPRKPRHLLLALLALSLAVLLPLLPLPIYPSTARLSDRVEAHPLPTIALTPPSPQADAEARAAYQSGRFQEAVSLFEEAIAHYTTDPLRQAMALGNLALAHQQLGQWEDANEAIARSLDLLATLEANPDQQSVQAQALVIAGQLALDQGQPDQALTYWNQSTELYLNLGDRPRQWQSQIYQAQALQALGFYRQAIARLEVVNQALQNEADSVTQVNGLQSLGDALRVAGNLERSRQVLEDGVAIARRLDRTEQVAALTLSLANTLQALEETEEALVLYQRMPSVGTIGLKAQLNQLSLLVQRQSWEEAWALASRLEAPIRDLPPGRDNIYARIKYAEALIAIASQGFTTGVSASQAIGEGLAVAIQHSQALGDRRAESYALGSLGLLYEKTRQYPDSQTVTQRAFVLAQDTKAEDLTYRWQWQLGRVLREQGKREEAIAAYQSAVATLQSLRDDLVAINPEVQFTFGQTVEPIHRELVSLLTRADASGKTSAANLESARQVIESLQQAELENFFREACLDAQPVAIDQIDNRAAIFYPVILPDRLEVIVRLPDRPLQHHSLSLSQATIEETLRHLERLVTRKITPPSFILPLAQTVYDWLIRPVATDLQESGVKTLVFVMDGVLRDLPIAILHDGNGYVIEDYSLALTPGLQLLNSQPLEARQLSVIAAGLTEERQEFSPLPGVEDELQQISEQVPSQILLNQSFTRENLQQAIAANPAPVVHLATHGQFSSNLSDSININQLNNLLQGTDVNRQRPIELLVMSACQTADGDQRAALGLAGMAVQAGARSTLASLWSVDDQATSELMVRFYQELAKGNVTKAEALRQAELAMLHHPESYLQRPFYWAAFVLLGNWL